MTMAYQDIVPYTCVYIGRYRTSLFTCVWCGMGNKFPDLFILRNISLTFSLSVITDVVAHRKFLGKHYTIAGTNAQNSSRTFRPRGHPHPSLPLSDTDYCFTVLDLVTLLLVFLLP